MEIFSFTLKKENIKKVILVAGTDKGFVRVWTLNLKAVHKSPHVDILDKNKHEVRTIQ
jgi:hypothetical protein